MHGKRAAIAPALADEVGLVLDVAPGIDTDALGTFTGEIARPGTMEETAILKARLGLKASGLALAVASEGSYGAHPLFPFIPGGLEMIVLVDDRLGLIIKETMIADETNYQHATAASADELGPFLSRARFPSHGLIVRSNQLGAAAAPSLRKGVVDAAALAEAVSSCAGQSADRLAFVQSDMRAHYNPTRMAVIAKLAQRLAKRVASLCPQCRAPGWGVVGVERGLACEACGVPTELAQAEIWGCGVCSERCSLPRPDGMEAAPARHCPWCNP